MLVVLWDWGIGGTFAAVVDVLSDVYDTFILTQVFKVDKTTICRTIRHVTPLTEQIWKIKQERLLSENDVQLLIVGTTEQRIERPKNQRDYYSGKVHAHTIKTEVVIDPKDEFYTYLSPMKIGFMTLKSISRKAHSFLF